MKNSFPGEKCIFFLSKCLCILCAFVSRESSWASAHSYKMLEYEGNGEWGCKSIAYIFVHQPLWYSLQTGKQNQINVTLSYHPPLRRIIKLLWFFLHISFLGCYCQFSIYPSKFPSIWFVSWRRVFVVVAFWVYPMCKMFQIRPMRAIEAM